MAPLPSLLYNQTYPSYTTYAHCPNMIYIRISGEEGKQLNFGEHSISTEEYGIAALAGIINFNSNNTCSPKLFYFPSSREIRHWDGVYDVAWITLNQR